MKAALAPGTEFLTQGRNHTSIRLPAFHDALRRHETLPGRIRIT